MYAAVCLCQTACRHRHAVKSGAGLNAFASRCGLLAAPARVAHGDCAAARSATERDPEAKVVPEACVGLFIHPDGLVENLHDERNGGYEAVPETSKESGWFGYVVFPVSGQTG